MTENELTRRALIDQLGNIIADYNTRELSDTEWEGLNGTQLECIAECLQFAQYKDRAIQALEENQQYHAIGTVEECREAVEKQKAKKVLLIKRSFSQFYACPACSNNEHYEPIFSKMPYCVNCGQHLDWE